MSSETDKRSAFPIHVALSPGHLDDDYNRHAATVMCSILDHTNRKVIFHILYLSSETDNIDVCSLTQERYRTLCSEYDADVLFHKIEPPEFINSPKYSNIHKYTYNAISRLHIPELLSTLNRVIYVDCDMIITTDFGTLWDLDLAGFPIAANYIGDISAQRICKCRVRKKLQLKWENYINDGLLVFNIPVINSLDFNLLERSHLILKKYPQIPFPDQDVLNYIFQGNIYFLNQRYNVSYYSLISADEDEFSLSEFDDMVIHYIGSSKPWNTNIGNLSKIYWYYFSKTPWCDSDITLIDLLHQLFPSPKTYLTSDLNRELKKISLKDICISMCKFNLVSCAEIVMRVINYIKNR